MDHLDIGVQHRLGCKARGVPNQITGDGGGTARNQPIPEQFFSSFLKLLVSSHQSENGILSGNLLLD